MDSSARLNNRGFSNDVYNDLVFYFKYASSAYSLNCTKPNGNTLVEEVHYSTLTNRRLADFERLHSSQTLQQTHRDSSHETTSARRFSSRFVGGK